MAGRRWKEALHHEVTDVFAGELGNPAEKPVVVLGGPANTYTHYIATPEEYSVQRYEGASTLYGPHTLDAHINLTLTALPHLSRSSNKIPRLNPGSKPPILINDSLSFITPVVVDRPPLFRSFGHVKDDVHPIYRPGDTISATFVGANPRNDFRLDGTFAAVDQFSLEDKVWRRVRDDSAWSLVYEWKRTSSITGTSEVTISWETKWETGAWRGRSGDSDDESHGDLMARDGAELKGLYRLRYYGDAKALGGKITPFEGVSSEFRIE